MIPDWVLSISSAIVLLLPGSALFYFLSQKQSYLVLWTVYLFFVLFLLIVTLYIRNELIIRDNIKLLTPKITVGVNPVDLPTTLLDTENKYPLQEYSFSVGNNNIDAVPFKINLELNFPYMIKQVSGYSNQYSGSPVFISNVKSWISENGKLTKTEGESSNPIIDKSMNFSIRKWNKNENSENSNVVIFSSESFPSNVSFNGKIIVDLSEKLSGFIISPDQIGKYTGKYEFMINGRKMPPVQINGEILRPNIDNKIADKHYDQGMQLLKNSDYVNAIIEFDQTIKLNPKHELANFQRGVCHGHLGHSQLAEDDFNKSIQITPRFAAAYYNRAVARIDLSESKQSIEDDYYKSFLLGFEPALAPYLNLILPKINPKEGFLERPVNYLWFNKNGALYTIIPNVSKDEFQLYAYRDDNNIFKVRISTSLFKNANLKFKNIELLKVNDLYPRGNNFTISWNQKNIMLFICDALVDVFPRELKDNEQLLSLYEDKRADLFNKLLSIDPNKGYLEFDISNPDWLDNNGEFISILPHIITDNFEIFVYRDSDFTLKTLISNRLCKHVILKYNDLIKMKKNPTHPNHSIRVSWGNEGNKLLIDGELKDSVSVIE